MPAPPFTLTNAPEPLVTPTYDGSGQAVHPSVLRFFRDEVYCPLPSPYSYIMALTPYPYHDSSKENPSLLLSEDGETWVEDGITNPIEPEPPHGYLADPTLVWDGTYLYLYFGWYKAGADKGVYVRKSTDAINWTLKEKLPWGSPNPHIRYGAGLFYGTGVHPGLQIDEGIANYLVPNPRTDAKVTGKTVNYWHHTVRRLTNGKYWCIVCDDATKRRLWLFGRASARRLWLLESDDYYNWIQFSPEIMSPSENGWDDRSLYKADFYVLNGKVHVYYSAHNPSGEWHFGYTEADCGLPKNVISDNVFCTNTSSPIIHECYKHKKDENRVPL